MENQVANITLNMTYEERFEFLKLQSYTYRSKSDSFMLIASAVEKMGLETLVNRSLIMKDANTIIPAKSVAVASAISIGMDILRNKFPVYGELVNYVYRGNGPLGYMAYSSGPKEESEFVYNERIHKLLSGLSKCFNFKHVALPTIFLYGPPGTGKSSAGKVVADLEGSSYCQMSAQEFADIREEDKRAKENLNDHTILIIDELDKIDNFEKHLPKLLAFLDQKQKDQLIILTSNNDPNTFPQALLRPGRVDVIEKIDYLDKKDAEKLFKLKFKILWKQAMKAYDEANNNPETYQPACVAAFCESVKRQCITDIINNGEEMPKVDTLKVSFADNFKAHKESIKTKGKSAEPSSQLLKRLLKLHGG